MCRTGIDDDIGYGGAGHEHAGTDADGSGNGGFKWWVLGPGGWAVDRRSAQEAQA